MGFETQFEFDLIQARKTARSELAKYASMEPLSQDDKDRLDNEAEHMTPVKWQEQKGIMMAQRELQRYFRNPEHMEACTIVLLRRDDGTPLLEVASWERMSLLSPEEILTIAEKDPCFIVNYGQGEDYRKPEAITLRLDPVTSVCSPET